MCINMLHTYHQKKYITLVMGKSYHAVRNFTTQLTNTLQNVSQKIKDQNKQKSNTNLKQLQTRRDKKQKQQLSTV